MNSDPSAIVVRNPRVRAALIKAARELFDERGYQNVRTREISARAGVDESTLFRHFESKRDLFEAAVLEPFSRFVERWVESTPRYPADAPLETMVRNWVGEMYDFTRENQGILRSLLAAQFARDDDLEHSASKVSEFFASGIAKVREAGVEAFRRRNVVGLDPPVTHAAEVSMVLGIILFSDWLYPKGTRRPGRKRVINELSAIILHGLSHRENFASPVEDL